MLVLLSILCSGVDLYLYYCDLAVHPHCSWWKPLLYVFVGPLFVSPSWSVNVFVWACICICVIWQFLLAHWGKLAGWLVRLVQLAFQFVFVYLCICICVFAYLYLCDLAISHSEEKLAGAPCATSSPVCNQVTLAPYIQPPPPLFRQASLCVVFLFVCCVCMCVLCLYLYLCLCNQVSFTTSIWLFMILMLSKTILVLIFTQSFDSYPRLTLIHI